MSAPYFPGSLPEITSAEVVVLSHVDPARGSHMRAAGRAPAFRVEGERAQRLADLWRRLPPGKQSRCHIPAFGFRFFSGRRLVCEASVCWRCDNIHGEWGGESFGYEFDAEAPVSRELLSEAQQVTGEQSDA
jgi:hypothetical protein